MLSPAQHLTAQSAAELPEERLIGVLRPPVAEDQYAPVITALAIHPSGKLLAAAGDDHLVRIWELRRGKMLGTHSGHEDWVRSAIFSRDGSELLTAAADGRVLQWSPQERAAPRAIVTREKSLLSLAMSRDGKLALVAGFNSPLQLIGTGETRSDSRGFV